MSAIILYDMQPNPVPRCLDLNTSRIMVMGDTDCGKTSFILRCLNNAYSPLEKGAYEEDIYHKSVKSQNVMKAVEESTDYIRPHVKRTSTIDVQFLDSAPFEIADFSDVKNEQILQSDAFIICFDSTNRESFINVRTYQRRIERIRGIDDKVPILIVGTKVDQLSERRVQIDEIMDVLNRFELHYDNDYFEISSKHNINVKELFTETLIKIEKYKNLQRIQLEIASDRNMTDQSDSRSSSQNGSSSQNTNRYDSKIDAASTTIASSSDSKNNLSKTEQLNKRTISDKSISTKAEEASAKSFNEKKEETSTQIKSRTLKTHSANNTCCVIC